MGTKLIDVDYDFGSLAKVVRALHNPVATDPVSPVNGEIWYNSTTHVFKFKRQDGVQTIATIADVTAGAITETLWDAQSVVTAVLDNTPVAQVLAAGTVLGRRTTGDITAVTYANLLADLEALGVTAADLEGSNLATVLARANHTGTQLAATISDFNTAADARVVAGTADLVSQNLWDAQSVVKAVVDNTPVVQTFLASTVLGRRAAGDVTAVTYADLLADLEALGITAADLQGSNLATVLSRANHTGTQLSSTISDFNTAVDARVEADIAALIDAAPASLDTLNELAAALGDDPNFAATMTASLATKTTKYSANFGNAALQTFAITHSLGTTDVVVSVRVNSTGAVVDCQVVHTDANTVTITTNSIPAANAYRVVVVG